VLGVTPVHEASSFGRTAPWLAEVEGRLAAVARPDGAATQAIVEYVRKSGGKRLRPLLVLLSARAFGAGADDSEGAGGTALRDLAVAVELVHIASLLHDDLIDGAATRRGLPTVAHRWGPAAAVLSGDYLFSVAFELLVTCGQYESVRLLSWALRSMSESEIEQLNDLNDLEATEQEYLHRVKGKTASLFAAACAAGAAAGGAGDARTELALKFGEHLGIAYQVADDLLDVIGHAEDLGKPVGQDLSRGVITLPVILLLRDGPASDKLRRIIACRGFSKDAALWLREQALATGAADRTRSAVRAELGKAWSCLERLEGAARQRAQAMLEPVERFVLGRAESGMSRPAAR